jgi:SagB-type dehydrogenase family enzyme
MADPLENVFAYHGTTKHHLHAYAPGPGRLDWATQPDPFRRYDGAPVVALERPEPGDAPLLDEALREGALPAAALDRQSVSRLFFDSLALSAWKQAGPSRWALRVNPSSGNLHPTEGYLVSGPVDGLFESPVVCHYAPKEHALEVRARVPAALWRELAEGFPAGTAFVGLTSIYWREAWKYGERAYRYCNHDVGHAIAALAVAAAGLGWRATLLDDLGADELALLLGVSDPPGAEPEHPDCLLAISPAAAPRRTAAPPPEAVAAFAALDWRGTPNRLSPRRVIWPAIEAVAVEARKPATRGAGEERSPALAPWAGHGTRPVPLRRIVHQRRSAVAFDGRTFVDRDAFLRILEGSLPQPGRAPFATLPWRPLVHLGLFVHRVRGIEPGLYALVRRPAALEALRAAMPGEFAWEAATGAPEGLGLYRLMTGDARAVAEQVSCHQDIAADGCFSLGMIAEFERPLRDRGPWFYPRLFWETGVVGQALYLEAEAAGLRGTGIGCFFDDAVHSVFGLGGLAYQSLYHFTVGEPVEDSRLTTLPPYPGA